jgi:homocysteine S-methyltransferase
MGATIVGGCCETGPAHIAALSAALRAAGHSIV